MHGDAVERVLGTGGDDYGDAALGDAGSDVGFGVELPGLDGGKLYGDWERGGAGGRVFGSERGPRGFDGAGSLGGFEL
jgi:hypothetical protein